MLSSSNFCTHRTNPWSRIPMVPTCRHRASNSNSCSWTPDRISCILWAMKFRSAQDPQCALQLGDGEFCWMATKNRVSNEQSIQTRSTPPVSRYGMFLGRGSPKGMVIIMGLLNVRKFNDSQVAVSISLVRQKTCHWMLAAQQAS